MIIPGEYMVGVNELELNLAGFVESLVNMFFVRIVEFVMIVLSLVNIQ